MSSTESLPSGPFQAWLQGRLDAIRARSGAHVNGAASQALADELGVSTRLIYRYLHEHDSPLVSRRTVQDAADAAGVGVWEIYPELADEHSAGASRHCPSCHEIVTVGADGLCPWCETPGEDPAGMERRYCPKCDKMMMPAGNGSCWRCGSETKGSCPWDECPCGCGAQFARFDATGRRRQWVRGHAPRAEAPGDLDAGPFSEFVEAVLRSLDPIEAVASRLSLPRETVLDLLERRVKRIPRETVIRALFVNGRQGQGKGMPRRPGTPKLHDLYPEDARARRCPGCGQGKARQASLCKQCSRKARRRPAARGPARMGEPVLQDARKMRRQGMAVAEISRRLLARTGYSSAASFAHALRTEFRRRPPR